MQRKHSKEMAVRWLIILVLALCLPLLPSVSSAPASPLAAVAEQVVIVEEPTLTPAFGPICTTGWYGFDNNRGQGAYLTLNTNNPGQSTNSGRWTPNLPQAGSWRVEAFIPNHSAMTWPCTGQYIAWDTSDARYTIHHSGGVHTVSGNQSPFFDGWLDLGAYDFAAGSGGYVELVDVNGEANLSRFVSFSAIRFTWESAGGEGSSITTVEEPTTLHPGYTGDTCTCGWYRLDTDRGHYAYLTLNTNDPGQSTNWAQWRPTLAEAGDYRVEAYIPNHSPFTWPCTGQYISWDTSDARYKIYHAAGMTEAPGNQSPLANQWLDLGVFHFNAGTNGYVELADLNGEANLSHFVSFSAVRFTKQSGGSSVETLILINRARIAARYGDTAATQIMSKLAQLAAHNSVKGLVVQVESTPAVSAAYSAWDQHLYEPAYANSVAQAIHALIDAQVAAHPEMKYLVLVGDDRIIPMRREPNEAYDCAEPGCGGWETGYLEVTCSSTVGSALCHEQNLSDNYFGDKVIEMWALHQPYVPDLAVGRLIENPTEIVTQIDLFLASDGRVPTRAGVVGADHARDGARAARDEWQGKGLPVDVLISNSWTRAQFIDQFLDQSHDLVGLYHHANHYQIVSGTGALNDRISSHDVSAGIANMEQSVIFSIGCHSGLNLAEATTDTFDLAQAFVRKGAIYIGSTGYSPVGTDDVALSERLMAIYADLVYRHSYSVGEALRMAKGDYCSTEADFDAVDEKMVLQATLYGLPMYELRIQSDAAGSTAQHGPDTLITQSLAVLSAGFSVSSLTYAFPDFEEVVNDHGTFFRLGGQTAFDQGMPIQPRASVDVSLVKTTAHGAVLRQATYTALSGFNPTIGRAAMGDSPTDEPEFDAPGWFPTVPYGISRLEATETLNIVLGQFDPDQATERLYSGLSFDVYYHDSSTDCTLPGILDVSSSLEGGQATVSVAATDDSGIHAVVVAYTDGEGSWQSQELAAGSSWTGSFSADTETEFFVQVVDGAGNVAVADNGGEYYQPGQGLGRLGGINDDGLVNSTDALIILSADAGLDTAQFCPMNCGDVNVDGLVNSTDALIVLTYDAGLPVGSFLVGQPGCPSIVTPPPGCNP